MPRNDNTTMGFAIPMDRFMQMREQEAPKRQPVMAQISDLEAAFACFNACHNFIPGDLVREREGMGFISCDAPVLIIMRFMDLSDKYDRNATILFSARCYLTRPDVIVAMKDDDGDLRLFPHETWRLEHYAEKRP